VVVGLIASGTGYAYFSNRGNDTAGLYVVLGAIVGAFALGVIWIGVVAASRADKDARLTKRP
jgi:hypothetical protein